MSLPITNPTSICMHEMAGREVPLDAIMFSFGITVPTPPLAGTSQFDKEHCTVEIEHVQPADMGLPTGNGKKLSCSQAHLGQPTCLAVA